MAGPLSLARRGAEVVNMKLEVVVLAVADVERAKDFYGQLGWRLDADFPSMTAFGSSSSRRPARAARFSSARI
jgi:catechol 2,3-dioxygenase-like lactoylglutathione lyase family enzyme